MKQCLYQSEAIMAESLFDQPRFKSPDAARIHLEAIRWPNGPICPHCGAVDRISKLNGKAHRPGVYDCGHCRDQFTVTVGTVFERSKVPLHKWLIAAALLAASKKGMSSHQLHRMLGVTYKTAWFMTHRLREAMAGGGGLLGSKGGPVEIDETFLWKKEGRNVRVKRGHQHKHAIFSLVDREGNTRSYHVADVTAKTLKPILLKQVSPKAQIYSDTAGQYKKAKLSESFASHETVNHTQKEYARGNVHTNTVESFFGIFKRGLIGTYHHVSEAHLQRYCDEFSFRFSNRKVTDAERADNILRGINGKRLTYRRAGAQA
jgi:transposase-like protein